MKNAIYATPLVALLAACGGGGDEPNAFAFDDPNDAASGSLDIFVAASGEFRTAFENVRPLGSATYQGYASVSLDGGVEEQTMFGTFELEADFVGNEISGSATDFVGVEPTGVGNEVASTGDVSGALSITNGTILDNGGRTDFAADIDGTLQDGGTRIDIDTILDGRFFGAGAEYVVVSGESAAAAEVTTVSSGASTQDLDILLLGERQ